MASSVLSLCFSVFLGKSAFQSHTTVPSLEPSFLWFQVIPISVVLQALPDHTWGENYGKPSYNDNIKIFV